MRRVGSCRPDATVMQSRRLVPWVIGIALVVVATLGIVIYRAVSVSLEAEKTLHAYRFVLDSTTGYVKQHPGEWPKSWDELLSGTTSHGSDQWPSIEDIKHRVIVDFAAKSSEIIQQDHANFTAITQSEPNYGPNEGRIKALQDAIRQGIEK
jgi:hypothetical protein